MIKGKSPEEIRKLFNIVNDFTPEEEVSPISRFAPIFLPPHVSDLLFSSRLRSRRRMSGQRTDESFAGQYLLLE